MYKLVHIVSENMKDFYPYLMEKISYNENLIKIEEETFHKTLKNGEALLNEEMAKAKDKKLTGAFVFKLYDTYGFPYELTAEIASENGITIDENAFKEEMQKQKDRARAARENVESMASQSEDLMNFTTASEFIGYDSLEATTKVTGLFKEGKRVNSLTETGYIAFDTTCFYAESGGQVSDTGYLVINKQNVLITDVKKAPHGQFLHRVDLEDLELKEGDEVLLKVDVNRRNRITANHSATHLLQSALKQVVGDHIAQAGSYNSEEYLRFDFTHFEKVNEDQLNEIESIVNRYIQDKLVVCKQLMSIEEAKKSGATALFDEKYGDIVRVVSMGDVSKEFCGGCHVNNTNEIGLLKIVSEESVGSGIRRITAKTGYAAYEEYKAEEDTLKTIAAILKMKTLSGVDEKVITLVNEISDLKKELNKLQENILMTQADAILKEAKEVDGKKVLIKQMDELTGGALKEMAISLRDKMSNSVVFLASANDDKVVFVAAADKALTKEGIHCGNLVKEAATICEGNGGGKPDLAQAGGKSSQNLDKALTKIASNLGLSL